MDASEFGYRMSPEAFRPCVVVTTDGRRLAVPSRDYLLYPPGGRTVVIMGPDERMAILDLAQVARIEVEG